MKNRKVLLSVTGVAQNQGNDDEAMHLVTTGVLSGGDDAWRLRYTETQPDTDTKHNITVTMNNGIVIMQREGKYGTSMVFEKGRRFEGSYDTPYGALDMGVFATQVKYKVEDDFGEVSLQYQLDLQGQYAAMHELKIRFAPRGGA